MTKKSGPAGWQEITTGCVVLRPGSASEYHTGSWRAQRPVWNNQKCIKCGICYVFCPEGCVAQSEDGFFKANLDYCKGCGICAHECWSRAIAMVEEG
ncbi:MAG: pyruvate ferredoxin oxidoreductase [Deltaproteobacteria bacterium HGW-Deltaproteobacteria-10]|nr:MAG: pyruvate ferredoxin oxidoreductase [Deltaproteobacteria bacterium HGW-Deltaproteobacteria-10]